MFLSNVDVKAETIIDSQSQGDQIPPISSPSHDTQDDQASLPVLVRPRKRIRTSLKSIDSTVVDHTIEEESLWKAGCKIRRVECDTVLPALI